MFFFTLLVLPLSAAFTCPGGLAQIGDKCYVPFKMEKNWLEAEEYCVAQGGHLAAIENAFVNSRIASLMTDTTMYWIGFNFLSSFFGAWTSGAASSYFNFGPGAPQEPSTTPCVSVKTANLLWTKEVCYQTAPFVCELYANSADVCIGPACAGCASPNGCKFDPLPANAPVGACGVNNVMSIGPCISGKRGPCDDTTLGYACDATLNYCCPVVNTVDTSFSIGPAAGGMCPIGYVPVYGLSYDIGGQGYCIDLNSVAGVCDASLQSGFCSPSDCICSTGYSCNSYAGTCCPSK